MKKQPKQSADPKRRAFLRGAAGAGVGAAVAVSLPGLTTASTEEASSDGAKPQKGYRLTPHIAAYYKTTVR
ncbi:MAG: formate dehydrogenase [Candidatus Thiodiazotropha sp. (ex Epidulcina cf. delphinae)]|nr:formate dehydrogenase [Candidatus Thiodiazotropha sp. (ex Epidulcina cf. delphinae)]